MSLDKADSRTTPARARFFELFKTHFAKGVGRKNNRTWTNIDFGTAVNVSRQTVGNWVSGKNLPSEQNIKPILDAFFRDQNNPLRVELECVWKAAKAEEDELQNAVSDERREFDPPRSSGTFEKTFPASNFKIQMPWHFQGRDDELIKIELALETAEERLSVAVLFGMPGVGKTVLANAYAARHGGAYRAIWTVNARTAQAMQSDLSALGVRLGWVDANEGEQAAFDAVSKRLPYDGDALLLVYENAPDAETVRPYLPSHGACHVIVTTNNFECRRIGQPIGIETWPKGIGGRFLIARAGSDKGPLQAAEALSETLDGLPLALEQAAAYCERITTFAEYERLFKAEPISFLEKQRYVPTEYGLTVARTFTLAVEAATELNAAAEPLIVHAAMLAPVPIPMFLFSDARASLGAPLAEMLAEDGLDEAVLALRAFSLIDRVEIPDERSPSDITICIQLHRLVREVAKARWGQPERRRDALRAMLIALLEVYPLDVADRPELWMRLRRLNELAVAAVDSEDVVSNVPLELIRRLSTRIGQYNATATCNYQIAEQEYSRSLDIAEKIYGRNDARTAAQHNLIAHLLFKIGKAERAIEHIKFVSQNLGITIDTPCSDKAPLSIDHNVCEVAEASGARSLQQADAFNALAVIELGKGNAMKAGALLDQAFKIKQEILGDNHSDLAMVVNNIGAVQLHQGNIPGSIAQFLRALSVSQEAREPKQLYIAQTFKNLAGAYREQGDREKARLSLERALKICSDALGDAHPKTINIIENLIILLWEMGQLVETLFLFSRAIAASEALDKYNPLQIAPYLDGITNVRMTLHDPHGARPYMEKAYHIREKALGLRHPDTLANLKRLRELLIQLGDVRGAEELPTPGDF